MEPKNLVKQPKEPNYKKLTAIEEQVLEVILVPLAQHEKIKEILSILREKISLDLKSLGFLGKVELQGSFARKTYLNEDDTFDLLLILQREDRPKVHQILDALLKRLEKDRINNNLISVEKHTGKIPYLRIFAEGELINLFVGFEVIPGDENISIFDFIPMHTQYIRTHLKEEMRKEILLLKKFVKSIGVYRNEIGAIGFNGYLCELLIIYYGSFRNAIEGISKWKARKVIDLKRNYEKTEDVDTLTSEMLVGYYPLYVPDPLNPKDNVAKSVSIEQFNSIIGAANIFLFEPSISFFEENICEPPHFDEIVKKIINSGRELVTLIIERNFTESEICWQKALKLNSAFQAELMNNNYLIERMKPFVSDEYFGIFINLVDSNPKISMRKEGPKITSKESLKFLQLYTKHTDVVAGPFIDDGRWVIHFVKKGQIIFDFLDNLIKKNTFVLNIDSFQKIEVKEKMKVVGVNEELKEFYENDTSFAENLFLFIERKPLWICNIESSEINKEK
ncbi:MAG: hypothetical protein ACTSUR_02150 [Candidatus Heimdallarchaeaceae archaeon]